MKSPCLQGVQWPQLPPNQPTATRSPTCQPVVIGAAPDPLGISPNQLLLSGRIVRGHPSGTAQDVQDTLAFSALHGIRPMIEIVPLDQAAEAYQKMISGAARFRMVLTTR
jgi:alcohol dehydrogenase